MNFLNGKVEVFLGPTENGASDNLESVIIAFIDAAEFSLQVAVQEIDSKPIADALDRAARFTPWRCRATWPTRRRRRAASGRCWRNGAGWTSW